MERKVYIADEVVSLSEYIDELDDRDCYECWQDEDTQRGFNHRLTRTFEEWSRKTTTKSRFTATVIRLSDNASVGTIFLSQEGSPPDLAIKLYKAYRGSGYGTQAFALGVRYCFERFGLAEIYAGCFPHNAASMRMLEKCGFKPHPEGNVCEKHYLTGEDIIQYDFIKLNPNL